jgi:hypothetical protein
VPVIAPLLAFSVSPAGSAGLTDQVVAVPVSVGSELNAVPSVAVAGLA